MEAVEGRLDRIQNEMGFMGLVTKIPVYEGDSKEFKEWFKSVDRARMILGEAHSQAFA